MARYLVGIDLGTTNSALAFIDTERKVRGPWPEAQTFPIPQLTAPGELGERPLLPSFLYLPGAHDLPAGSTAVPWDKERPYAVGEFARNHGARVPGRLVTSAKSWLCHAGVDRSAALLPWAAPPDVARISPVEAARQAGLENLTLLEEPQAAFYCWLAMHAGNESAALKPGSLCLVVDVGGGTSDFSLIEAVAQQGELGFVRQAVGDHLLLGGDNMDLALAKGVEKKLPAAGKLDAVQYGLLTQACRFAKETLLGPAPPATHTVTVVGRGRQVIGGTLHTPLTAADVRQLLSDVFFP